MGSTNMRRIHELILSAKHLFHLGKDLGEQHDLSAQFPERVKTMREDFQT